MAATVTGVEPLLHSSGGAVAVTLIAAGPVIVTVAVPEQLFASVTVKVCVPAPRAKNPVPVYGAVPPVAVTVTFVVPLPQRRGSAIAATDIAGAAVIVTVAVPVQLFASVTVKVCVPVPRVNVPVPV